MITPEKLYAATDQGLRILALHFNGIEEAARNNKPFRARPNERTPSAWVRLYSTNAGKVWKVTDFGGEGRAVDPIDIHMEKTGLRFGEAILDLASIFNVSDELNRSVNRPDVRKQPALPEQEDGSCSWEIDQEFSDAECKVMGPRVTAEHLKALHWYRVKHIVTVKNREATYKYSNRNYPIFMRECWFEDKDGNLDRFYKIYEPLNVDKQWRFQYQPKGKKPQRYTNGLFELRTRWREYNDAREKEFYKDPANESKSYKEEKLPGAVICSGERDSLCVRSLGYNPIWFNSETYRISDDEMREICRYVEEVYNIPDIDATGIVKGTDLALQFIDVRTVWLPEKLRTYRDHRGNPRKDLRDWMEIWDTQSDFRSLLELSLPAKFWKQVTNETTGKTKTALSVTQLFEFLRLNGFYRLRDNDTEVTTFIRITGNVVKTVTADDIRGFVRKWAYDHALPLSVRDLILSTSYLGAQCLCALEDITLDFCNCTPRSQFFYLKNFTAEITPREIIRHDNRRNETGRYVWDKKVIDHNVTLLPDMFVASRADDGSFSLDVLDTSSNYFRYLINSSRLYWRQELEYGLAGKAPEEAAEYRKEHRFDIAGPTLTDDQRAEQCQCLLSKIFTIGYMLHRYKSPSRTWAAYGMDNVIGENDQCNGRSGKSFMFMALANFLNYVKLSGRDPKLLENKHVFEQVTRHTDLVLVDDCAEYLPIKQFYDSISSDITVNPKGVKSYNIKYRDAPKFAFTTNYVPKEFDPSSRARMLYLVFSDYYHEVSEDNDYLETRKIKDDFGKDLFTDEYTDREWNADINFLMQCVRFYLSLVDSNVKIEPNLNNIIFRKHLRDMSDNFREWAEYYFAESGDNVNREIIRQVAFEDYKRYSGASKTTMQTFSRALKGFCFTTDYVECLNPEEMHTSGNRILRRVTDAEGNKKMQEMIYVRTRGHSTPSAVTSAPSAVTSAPSPSLFGASDDDDSDPLDPDKQINWDEIMPPH